MDFTDYSDQESEIGVWLKTVFGLLSIDSQENENFFCVRCYTKSARNYQVSNPHCQNGTSSENEYMPSIGIPSANRRIKAAWILAFPLLPHDFQNMRTLDCKLIINLR